jgi:hypothetical protein
MAADIHVKTFEADTVAVLESDVNTFLDTLDKKDILDVMYNAFSSAKYGTAKTYTAMIVYKVT